MDAWTIPLTQPIPAAGKIQGLSGHMFNPCSRGHTPSLSGDIAKNRIRARSIPASRSEQRGNRSRPDRAPPRAPPNHLARNHVRYPRAKRRKKRKPSAPPSSASMRIEISEPQARARRYPQSVYRADWKSRISKGRATASSASAAQPLRAVGERRAVAALARATSQGRRARVGADARCAWGSSASSVSSRQPDPVPTSRMRSGRASQPSSRRSEDGRDQRLAVGARVERRGRNGKAAAIEVALAQDARYGLARRRARAMQRLKLSASSAVSGRSGAARTSRSRHAESAAQAAGARRRPRPRCRRCRKLRPSPAAEPRRA